MQDFSPFIIGGCAIIAALVSILINSYMNRQQRIKEERVRCSRAFLDESVFLLERAYDIFTHYGSNPPKADRVLWMTTARMLIRFSTMKSRITEPDHIDIANSRGEYWRYQFYDLIKENRKSLKLDYFIPSGDVEGVDVISRDSLTIINDFTTWKTKDGEPNPPDPLDSVDYEEMFSRLGSGDVPIASPYNYGEIIRHLRKYPGCWKDIVEKSRNSRG